MDIIVIIVIIVAIAFVVALVWISLVIKRKISAELHRLSERSERVCDRFQGLIDRAEMLEKGLSAAVRSIEKMLDQMYSQERWL